MADDRELRGLSKAAFWLLKDTGGFGASYSAKRWKEHERAQETLKTASSQSSRVQSGNSLGLVGQDIKHMASTMGDIRDSMSSVELILTSMSRDTRLIADAIKSQQKFHVKSQRASMVDTNKSTADTVMGWLGDAFKSDTAKRIGGWAAGGLGAAWVAKKLKDKLQDKFKTPTNVPDVPTQTQGPKGKSGPSDKTDKPKGNVKRETYRDEKGRYTTKENWEKIQKSKGATTRVPKGNVDQGAMKRAKDLFDRIMRNPKTKAEGEKLLAKWSARLAGRLAFAGTLAAVSGGVLGAILLVMNIGEFAEFMKELGEIVPWGEVGSEIKSIAGDAVSSAWDGLKSMTGFGGGAQGAIPPPNPPPGQASNVSLEGPVPDVEQQTAMVNSKDGTQKEWFDFLENKIRDPIVTILNNIRDAQYETIQSIDKLLLGNAKRDMGMPSEGSSQRTQSIDPRKVDTDLLPKNTSELSNALVYNQLLDSKDEIEQAMGKAAFRESSGGLNLNKSASASAARGMFGFIKTTWDEQVQAMVKKGLISTEELKSFESTGGSDDARLDPQKARRVMEFMTRNNREKFMQRYKKEPTSGDLYLMHNQGSGILNMMDSINANQPWTAMKGFSASAARGNAAFFYEGGTTTGRPLTKAEIQQRYGSSLGSSPVLTRPQQTNVSQAPNIIPYPVAMNSGGGSGGTVVNNHYVMTQNTVARIQESNMIGFALQMG